MRTLLILSAVSWLVAQQPPLKTIQEIQTPVDLAAGNDTSILHGQVVRVRGIVLTECAWHRHYGVSGGPNSKRCSIWLQEYDPVTNTGKSGPRTGLQIRRQNTTDMPIGFTQLQQGQYVELQGKVDYFQGEIQLLVDTLVPPIILNLSVPIAPPTPIAPDSVNQPGSTTHDLQKGDKWQGSFVVMKNLQVINVQTNPLRITAKDNNNNQVLIFGEFKGLTNQYPINTRLDSVRGIILHYKPSSGTPTYELCPWDDSLMYIGDPVPNVRNLTRTPVCPKSTDNVTVSVDVSSASNTDPITQVKLFYATGNSTTYTAIPMSQVGTSNTYQATIPAQTQGTYVHYFVRAYDQSGDSVRMPRFEPQSYRVNDAGCRITDIQYVIPSVLYAYNPNVRRDYLGSGYTGLQVTNVPGIVTASQNSSDTSLGYVYIQQPGATQWAGIWVRGSSLNNLRVGDSVNVDVATVDEYYGLTNLNNATVTLIGPAQSRIEPVVLPLNVIYGDTQYAATEPYESMLIRFRHDNPSQPLYVVATNPPPTFPQHRGDYRVGMDKNDPANGIRVLAGRQSNSIFSSLNVSYVNDSLWATQDGPINTAIPLCVVTDSTELDSLQGILTYQWNFIKLLPRNNRDFWNVRKTACTSANSSLPTSSDLFREVFVWPNPFHQTLTITIPQYWGSVQVELLSAQGQRIASEKITGTQQWSLPELPQGLYFLQVWGPYGPVTLRLVRL